MQIQDHVGKLDIGRAECGSMRHIIYKITNNINNRYYIGRHSTKNINDQYMGSGKAIKNAILKYGIDNFTKEIIAETTSAELLWELESEIVNDVVVNDPLSYNMAMGGRSYLDGLKKYDLAKFTQHQSDAGKIGGRVCYDNKTDEQKRLWHSLGGKAATKKQKESGHPFYTGEAASLGGKAVKDMVELWNPLSHATNKNQSTYKIGDCKKAKVGSEKYYSLLDQGWLPIYQFILSKQNSLVI